MRRNGRTSSRAISLRNAPFWIQRINITLLKRPIVKWSHQVVLFRNRPRSLLSQNPSTCMPNGIKAIPLRNSLFHHQLLGLEPEVVSRRPLLMKCLPWPVHARLLVSDEILHIPMAPRKLLAFLEYPSPSNLVSLLKIMPLAPARVKFTRSLAVMPTTENILKTSVTSRKRLLLSHCNTVLRVWLILGNSRCCMLKSSLKDYSNVVTFNRLRKFKGRRTTRLPAKWSVINLYYLIILTVLTAG